MAPDEHILLRWIWGCSEQFYQEDLQQENFLQILL